MDPRNKLHKITFAYNWKLLYLDYLGVFSPLGWSSGPDKLVGWPFQLKPVLLLFLSANCVWKTKPEATSHNIRLLFVQYHFAPHPPNKQINWTLIFKNENASIRGQVFIAQRIILNNVIHKSSQISGDSSIVSVS